MKKTQKKDAFRNIKKRFVSFLSVALVIMLGLGGVFITRYMGAGIDAEATRYYNEHSFKNYELISSLGITDDDIAQIKGTEGVTDAEGVIRTSGSLTKGSLNKNIELVSMTERISVPEVVEGSAPAAKDECMIGEDFAEVSGLKVGDKVRLTMSGISSPEDAMEEMKMDMKTGDEEDEEEEEPEEEDEDLLSDVLYAEEFTITGLTKHPDYLRRKSVDVVVLPWAAINKEVTDGYYTHAFVKADDPEGVDIFSDEYFEKTADTKASLEELAETLSVDSAERAKAKAYAVIDVEWQAALAELDGAQAQIDDGEAELNSELAKARAKLKAAQEKLNREVKKYNKKIKDGEKKVKEAESTLKLIDDNLPAAEKYVNEYKAEYEQEIAESKKTLNDLQNLLAMIKKLTPGTEDYNEKSQELAQLVLDNQDTIRKIHKFLCRDDVMKAAEAIRDLTKGKVDITDELKKIRSFDIEALIRNAGGIEAYGIDAFIKDVSDWIDSVQESLDKMNKYASYIAEYKARRGDLYKMLNDKKKEIKSAKKKLAAEKRKYQAQIRNGWNLYYSKKSAYESKLAEAKALLAENRELAEQKLAEAKAEVEKIECKCLVFDRRANAGYVDAKSNIAAVGSAGLVFGILFMLISAMVCLSTLAIIIEEQKKMVGTVKAFGFVKREILGKYMVFGVASAIVGCTAGILLALGLSGVVLKAYHNSGMYQFAQAKSVITPGITIGACLAMIAICAISTIIACSDILKSPASILMKGGTAKKGSGYQKTSSSRGGSLYSRLIIRNMREDKARVLISIIIIAFSTMLVGVGISMKLAYDGMSSKQVSDVFKYDVRVDLGDKVTAEDKQKLEATMTQDGAEFLPASYETHIFRLDDRLDALYVLTGDPERLGDYFAVNDPKTGEPLALPDDGVLAQKKMKESYGMGTGAEISMLNSELDEKQGAVKGVFQNYVGRLVITSPEGYKNVFGEDPTYNCYYVKAGGDREKLQNDLLAVNNDVSFEVASEFAKKFEAASLLYNLIVYVTTGIAIIMSFMILSNLANIFLNRKKTELTVMRINGFSIKQTRGYLARETVVTTAAGVIVGVLAGAVLAPLIIKTLEQPDLQFVRTFHPVAWIAAVVLEVLFSVIINSLVFRKVKDLNFRDVA